MSLLERVGGPGPTFASCLEQHGSRWAIAQGSSLVTYEELDERVDETARSLGPGRRLVLVTGANEVGALVAYLAALRAGHPLLLAPGGNEEHLGRLVDAFDPDVLLTRSSAWTVEERRRGTVHGLHPDLALLLSTSGSTGSPKLVRLSRGNLDANTAAIVRYLDLRADDRAITSLPMHYCYGLSVLNTHLAVGAGIVLTERSVVDACFWDDVRRHEVTTLAGVPHTFDLLERVGFESMALPSLRRLTQAGGRLDAGRVQRYADLGAASGWGLYVMYGQTEATARMAYLPPALAASNPGSIGVPIPGGAFALEPVDGCEDDVGELVYRGANVMLGYADHADDLALGRTVDALHTGDLARRNAQGLYEIVGRRSRIAKLFGLRVDLDHVECILAERSIEAICTSDDRSLVVAVTRGQVVGDVRRLVRRETGLPASRVVVLVLPELPRLANGKPDHGAVADAAQATVDAGPAPPDPLIPAGVDPGVHRAFVDVLQRSDITGESTFVDLGGDSLSYVEMSLALEDHLGALPASWPTTPVKDLQPARSRRGRLHQVETSVVLRAVSIVLVVGTHIKLFEVLGGAHLLLGVAGYNFARFQARPADRARSIARIAVPTMVWLAVASALDDRIGLAHVLLVNGWLGTEGGHGGYWYVEAIVQILVPLAVLSAVPAVRRLEHAHRAAVPALVLAAGLAIRFGVVDVPTAEPHDIRPQDIFWIFALGWLAAELRSPRARLILSVVVIVTIPGYFGEPAREALIVAGLLLLIWVPTLRLVRPVTRVVGSVAAASLYIYLTHWQVFPPLREHLGPEVALLGSVVAGVAAWHAVRAGGRALQRRRQADATRAVTDPDPSLPGLATA